MHTAMTKPCLNGFLLLEMAQSKKSNYMIAEEQGERECFEQDKR